MILIKNSVGWTERKPAAITPEEFAILANSASLEAQTLGKAIVARSNLAVSPELIAQGEVYYQFITHNIDNIELIELIEFIVTIGTNSDVDCILNYRVNGQHSQRRLRLWNQSAY